MPIASVNGVDLHYDDVGSGFPVIFCHEFSSDLRAWDQQVRWFSRRYRCIRYNYRGYPPSSVPPNVDDYSHEALVVDLRGLLAYLKIESTYLVGVATGGTVTLNLAIENPELVRALVVIGSGAGSVQRDAWLESAQQASEQIARDGMQALVARMERAPQRQALRIKDPICWLEFIRNLHDLSSVGCSHMMANALMRRKTFYALESQIKALPMPTLVVIGDQDTPAFEPCVYLSRMAPHGALVVFPFTGHMVPLEEPMLLNTVLGDFFSAADNGRWGNWRASAMNADVSPVPQK